MQKNLGQHFLHSNDIAIAIVDALNPNKQDLIVEIGPGTGVLTKLLIDRAKKVIAIEKDPELYTKLQKNFHKDIESGKLVVIKDDIRNFDPDDYGLQNKTYKLIGNIPYYITGKILRMALSADPQPSRAVFMVQKEVAERIVKKNNKESLLSLSVKAYGTPKYIKTVKKGSFSPPPRVDSAILAIRNISRNFFLDVDEGEFFSLLKKGFSHKRKQLINNLEISIETFRKCNLDKNIRAENLTLENWKCLLKRS